MKSDNFESSLGRLGARLDVLMERAREEGHRVDDFVERLRSQRDESRVRLNLAKLEVEERMTPVLEEIAATMVEIEDNLDAMAESIRRSVAS